MRPLFALFIRSVREDSRARLPILLRTALVLIILLILFGNQRMLASGSAPGRDLFMMIMMLNCAFIGIMALSIFPTAIAEEKEDETLTLLRMTNLSAVGILLGKSTSRLLAALILLAVQIPFTLLCVTLGGISQTQVWGTYAILAATTFFLCNLSLLASVFCKTTIRAGFLTGIMGGILYFGLPFLVMVRSFRRVGIGSSSGMMGTPTFWEQIGQWILQANPIYALAMLLENRSGATLYTQQIWFSLGGGVLCFLLSWLIFDRYCTKTGEETNRPKIKNRQGKVRRLAQVSRPGVRWPLAWKDFHFMVGGRFGLYLRCAMAAAIFGATFALASWSSSDYGGMGDLDVRILGHTCEACLGIACWVAVLEILLLAGRVFGVERQRLTLSSLVGLPWKPGRLIRQKIWGCLPALLPWLALAAFAVILHPRLLLTDILGHLKEVSWKYNREDICACAYVCLQAVLLLITIAWFSLRIRRGALPSAIVALGVWNFLFAIVNDNAQGRWQYLGLLVGVWLTLPAILLMARAVYYRLQLVAAEE